MSNLTVGLQHFIRTSGVVPPQFQLEFLERMGNLCTYSGQTMTPEFKLWLERKFGLQFVSAVQEFSTWDIPKLTSDTVRLLSLHFPVQYRGDECRLAFIRLFDVTCESPELCLYKSRISFSTAPAPQDLSITSPLTSGNLAAIQLEYPTFGANVIAGGSNDYYLQIISDGSDLEGWTYDDLSESFPIEWDLDACPARTYCYESEVMDFSSYPDATISSLFGYQYLSYGQVFFIDSGSYQSLDDYIKGTYGTQTSASIVDLGSGQYKVVVNNISLPTGAALTITIDLDGIQPPVTFTMNEIPC